MPKAKVSKKKSTLSKSRGSSASTSTRKTTKKASSTSVAKSLAQTTRKLAQPKKLASSGLRRSRQVVDEVLVKVSPQVQKRVDQLISTLHDTKEARMGDLKWLAGQILLRSRDISEQLKSVRLQEAARRASKKVFKK